MKPSQSCPQCGAARRPDAPAGHCPRCLFETALAVDPTASLEKACPDDGRSCGHGLPRRFGDYELLGEMGRGGMGVVYRARQLSLDRLVALKMMGAGPSASPAARQRFQLEARAVAQLDHPNLVAIYDVGEVAGQPYFTMKLVEGPNLGAAIENWRGHGKMNSFQIFNSQFSIAQLMIDIARAVHHAHQHGVLHRDLKPTNILLDAEGRPHLTDFGLAKLLAQEGEMTRSHELFGSPNYMAPEQAAGGAQRVTIAADVYGLGAILYKLLTGRPPFVAETPLGTLHRVLHEEPLAPGQFNPEVRRDLETICLKCLGKESARRYASALAVAEELERFLRDEPIHARPARAAEKLRRWCRRQPLVAGLAGAIVVLLVTTAIGSSVAAFRIASARDREQRQRQRAEQTVSLLEMQRAQELFAADDAAGAVAHLARALRVQPTNRVAAERLLNALTYRDFALPADDQSVSGNSIFPGRARTVTISNSFVRLADARNGELLCPPLRHEEKPSFARLSADGRRAATAAGSAAHVWDTLTGQRLFPPLSHRDKVYTAEFSPDGRRVVTASKDNTARVWDAQTGQPITSPIRHGGRVGKAIFSPDGERILTSGSDGRARIWDAQTGAPAVEWLRHLTEPEAIQFAGDGQQAIITLPGGDRQIWDVRPGQAASLTLRHTGRVTNARFSAEGGRVVTSCDDGRARVWDARTGALLSVSQNNGGRLNSARFSPGGVWVVTASDNAVAQVWDAASGAPAGPAWMHQQRAGYAEFSPDNTRVASASWDGTVCIWARTETDPLLRLKHTGRVTSVRFSPDGGRVVTTCYDQNAWLWDLGTGQPAAPPLRHAARPMMADFSTDGRLVVTASRDKTARVWDARSGRPVSKPLRHDSVVHWAEFSPDGRRIATATEGHSARVWDVATARPLTEPLKHGQIVFTARFSRDGHRLVTASVDGTARVWDVNTGLPLGEPLRHDGYVAMAEFSPDGRWIVTASHDATARLWEVPWANGPAPAWLPELAEAVGGSRLNADGLVELAPATRFQELKAEILQKPARDHHTRWAHWFLADRTARPFSPSAPMSPGPIPRVTPGKGF